MAKLNTVARRGERGQAIIELALTLPLLLLVVLGIFDFGFMFQRYEVVTNAAREGARIAVLPGYSAADAAARAITYLEAGGIQGNDVGSANCNVAGRTLNKDDMCAVADEIDVTLPPPSGGGASKDVPAVRVVVEYDYEFVFVGPLMNLFGGNLGTTRLRAVSVMREEPD